jgi:hypothetical protein
MARLITAALIILAISVCSRGDDKTITHNDQQERSLSSKTYCPKNHNGKVPAEYCSSYVECTDGVQGDRHFCAQGTKFDIVSQTCIWPSDLEVCEPYIAYARGYTTDMYADGTNYCPEGYDGRAPVYMCSGYVTCENGKYISGAQCQYGTKFDTDTQMCVSTVKDCSLLVEVDEAQMMEEMIQMEATGTTKEEEAERIATNPKPKVWYPVYGEDTCKKDGQHSQYEVNFFMSYDECCEFDFMNTAACLENKPVYYANYDTNTCTNDGTPSVYENMLYTSHSDCCQNNEWIDSDACISAGEGSMEQNSASGTTGMKYYPD